MSREQHLVSVDWLVNNHADPDVIVVDCRWYLDGPEGRHVYEAGHIPDALFVDVDHELSGPVQEGRRGGRHPLPDMAAFAATLARLGVRPQSVVVAYDDRSGAIAARLWWLLRYVGHPGGRILDGGIDAWIAEGHPLGTKPHIPDSAPLLTLSPRADMIVDAAGVAARGPATCLIDARTPDRYRGDDEPIDPRAGHIPGAINLPWTDNLGDNSHFAEEAVLEAHYQRAMSCGEVIAYCGSGVTACHDLLALALLGRDDARLYVGSWSDWCSDPERPVATGNDP
ncbi:MAG: sulfurtransferase [Myxococcales bacterium]|nr:sulfurtransferase [Myxococcales bacterium]